MRLTFEGQLQLHVRVDPSRLIRGKKCLCRYGRHADSKDNNGGDGDRGAK